MYVYTYLDNVIPSCERSLLRARATCLSVRRPCLGTTLIILLGLFYLITIPS